MTSPSTCLLALCSALALGLPAFATAADLYRWVDENGKVHFADVVPPKYKDSATRVEPTAPRITEQQRLEAAARAAQERARAAEMAAARAASGASPGASSPQVALDCATRHRLYKESLACFAPYRTVHGATKAEAFEKCTPVQDPTYDCGQAPRDPHDADR